MIKQRKLNFLLPALNSCLSSIGRCSVLHLVGALPLPAPGLCLLPRARLLPDRQPVPLLPLRLLLLPLLHPQPHPLQRDVGQVQGGLPQLGALQGPKQPQEGGQESLPHNMCYFHIQPPDKVSDPKLSTGSGMPS